MEHLSEIRELMEDIFDEPFWEAELKGNIIEKRLEEGGDFILFEIKDMPFGLVSLSKREDSKREIYQFDIEDYLFCRDNGLGKKVIELLRDKIYPNETLFGYSVFEAVKFWSKNSSSYDKEMYQYIETEHFKNGGEEDELLEVNGLMYFEL